MSFKAKMGWATAMLPVLSAAFFSCWWFFGHVAQANDTADRTERLELIVEMLADLHKKADTAEEAKREQLAEMCADPNFPRRYCTLAVLRSTEPATDSTVK